MSTLYLHIGTPKTGTTAIQNFMWDNRKIFKSKSCFFPDFEYRFEGVRHVRNGHFLTRKANLEPDELEKCWQKLYDGAKKYDKIVLTDEGLWNFAGDKAAFWKMLLERLEKEQIELRVIAYLRRQDDYLCSYWAQQVKDKGCLRKNFHTYIKSGDYNQKNHLDYQAYVDQMAGVIGKERLQLRPYEYSAFKDGNLIADFLDQIGVELTDEFQKPERFDNSSFKDIILEAKLYLNRVPEFWEKHLTMRQYLEVIQKELAADGKLLHREGFTKEEKDSFMEQYAKGNAHVAREYFGFADGVLFHEDGGKLRDETPFQEEEIRHIYDRMIELSDADPKHAFETEELRTICEEAIEKYHETNKKPVVKKNSSSKKTDKKSPQSFVGKVKRKLKNIFNS